MLNSVNFFKTRFSHSVDMYASSESKDPHTGRGEGAIQGRSMFNKYTVCALSKMYTLYAVENLTDSLVFKYNV